MVQYACYFLHYGVFVGVAVGVSVGVSVGVFVYVGVFVGSAGAGRMSFASRYTDVYVQPSPVHELMRMNMISHRSLNMAVTPEAVNVCRIRSAFRKATGRQIKSASTVPFASNATEAHDELRLEI